MTRRIHLPSLLMGALLGSTGLSVAGPGGGWWGTTHEAVRAVRHEAATLRGASAVLPHAVSRTLHASADRLDLAADRLLDGSQRAHHRVQNLREQRDSLALRLQACEQPVAVGPAPAAPDDLQRLRAALDAESFASDRLQRLHDALPGRWVTVDQILYLLEAFTFESQRVEAAVALYPHVLDPGEWYRVYDAFTFSSSKQAVRTRTSG